MNKLKQFKKCICDCLSCKSACKNTRPCWGTPKDIENIIDAGYGNRLMLDWWADSDDGNDIDFYIITPAIKGYEGCRASYLPIGQCSFFNSNELCDLHELNLKPLEGQLSSCKHNDEEISEIHKTIAHIWNAAYGKNIIKQWKEKYLDMIRLNEIRRKYNIMCQFNESNC